MPELPEVETLRRGLDAFVSSRRIVAVAIANPKVIKGQSEAEFKERIVGKRVIGANRRGKHLLLPLSADDSPSPSPSPDVLYVHLNMRGALRLTAVDAPIEKHECLSWTLEGSPETGSLRYIDVWGWGEVTIRNTEEAHRWLDGLLGAEPERLDEKMLLKRIEGRKSPIKSVLLEQKTVAGVGNIYADESLFESGIDPRRPATALSREEGDRLASAIRRTLATATEAGGSKGEFVDLQGNLGTFLPRIYDRGGQPCPVCRATLVKIRLGGRGTTFCPQCQK